MLPGTNPIEAGLDPPFLLLGAIILFSYTTQAITGFGSTVIALTLGAHLYSIPDLLPILVALNLPLCLYFVLRHGKKIDLPLLGKEILPWMTLGLVGGVLLLYVLPLPVLRPVFGVLIVIFAVREGIRLLRHGHKTSPMHPPVFRFWTVGAGVMHGLYASGGPLLVYALSRKNLETTYFRSTLMAVWLAFNVVLIGTYFYQDRWTIEGLRAVLFLLPVIPAGIGLGEFLHHRIPVRAFWILVQTVLLVSGASFLIR